MLLTANIVGQSGSSGPGGNQRLLCFVMDRLALAVSCGLPITRLVRALLSEPELARPGPRRAFWRQRLALLAGDLEEGRSLSEACERHLKAFLPSHFVPALRQAEQADRVREVLPLLARNLAASTRAIHSLSEALAYPLIQMVAMGSIVAGLCVFIVPKLAHLFDEMVQGQEAPRPRPLWALVRVASEFGPWLLFGALALVALGLARSCLARTARGRRLLESVCQPIPLAGRLLRRLGLVESASAMAAFLAVGVDVGTAARAAAESVETHWARRRLGRLAEAVGNGTPWAEAWAGLAVDAPLSEWMIRNAAAREQPRAGFQAVAEWATDDLNRLSRRLVRWLEPALILLNALVIGLVVYAMADALFGILYATLNL